MKLPITFWGKVISGKQRGRSLGFPTINTRIRASVTDGVYAAKLTVDKKHYVSVTFVGTAETFNETDRKAESFIFDFSENVYGKWVTVTLFAYIRPSIRFENQKQLIDQINKDVVEVKAITRNECC